MAGISCASRESPKILDDIATLKDQLWALQKQSAELGLRVSENGNDIALLTQRLKSFEEEKEAAASPAKEIPGETPPPVKTAPEKTTKPMGQKQGRLQEPAPLARDIEPTKDTADEPPGVSGIPNAMMAANTAAAELGQDFRRLNEGRMYKQAMMYFSKGEYTLAAAGFRHFILRFPASSLAPSAQYWIGDTFFSMKQYGMAAEEFKRLLRRYASSLRAPDATLKLGFCELRLDRRVEGKEILQKVIDRYPLSVAASTAKRELEKLQQAGTGANSGDS